MKLATTLITAALSSAVLGAPLPEAAPKSYTGTTTYDITGLAMRKNKEKIQSVSFTLSIDGKSVADCDAPQYTENSLKFCLLVGGASGYWFRMKDNHLMINSGFGHYGSNTANVAITGIECHVNGGESAGGDTNAKVSRFFFHVHLL